MVEVVVVGWGEGLKESTEQWHWPIAFLPSTLTMDKHCVLMSGSLIRLNKSSM